MLLIIAYIRGRTMNTILYLINCKKMAAMALSLTCCVAIIILLVTTTVHGRPEGATSAACGTTTDIAPSHNGNLPSDTALPYSVDLNDFTDGQYIPGNNYTITLSGGTDNPDFRGFMIQGRVFVDDSPTGQFTGEAGVSQPQCADDTAATHVNNNEKTSVSLTWTAPAAGTGAVRFRFAFVDVFALFWADIVTATIEEAASADPTDDPVDPTDDPVDPTDDPVDPTDDPVDPTDDPVDPTDDPVDPTDDPVDPTDDPVSPTDDPVDPTDDPVDPTGSTDPTTSPTRSCEDVTGLPECNEKLCNSRRNRYKKCFIVKDSCTKKCQVSRCLTCQYVRQPVKQPQRPRCVPCKTYYDRSCWHRYYICRYNYYKTSRHHYSRYYRSFYYHQIYQRVFKCFTQCRDLY